MTQRPVRIALGVLLAAAVSSPALAQYENASRAAPPPRQQTNDEAEQQQPKADQNGVKMQFTGGGNAALDVNSQILGLMDMNGDGLPDQVGSTIGSPACQSSVKGCRTSPERNAHANVCSSVSSVIFRVFRRSGR